MTAVDSAIELVIDALAAYRLTKLATDDVITQPPRDAVIRWAYKRKGVTLDDHPQEFVEMDEDPPKFATLVTCRWCAGMYIAAGIVFMKRFAPRQWNALGEVLTLSAAAALIAGLED